MMSLYKKGRSVVRNAPFHLKYTYYYLLKSQMMPEVEPSVLTGLVSF